MMEYINKVRQHVDSAFEIFKHHHNKNYDNNTAEHFKRKNIFRQNLRCLLNLSIFNLEVYIFNKNYIFEK